jgi:anti-sigma B factor antagonist
MAELNISERQAGDVTVLDLGGKITIGEGSVALRSAIKRLIEEGKKKILLNLGKVSYVDSSGIGELVSSFTTINREGGQLKLLNLSQKIQDLMTITKLHTVFDVYDDETAALVHQGANAACEHAGDEVNADAQRTDLDEDRRHRSLPRIELRLDDRSGGAPVRIGLFVEDFSLQEDGIEQRIDVGPLLR